MESNLIYVLRLIEWLAFCIAMLGVLYIVIFSFSSLFKSKSYPETPPKKRFLVLFPAYREDNVIIQSVENFLLQDYPRDLFEIAVISDGMKQETNITLGKLPIKLIIAHFENSTKAKALQLAMEETSGGEYDIVVIMDADNSADCNFLHGINNAAFNESAIQAHRTGKNRNTDTAVLDGVSEEINNSIFRKGHVNLHLSSALIGSGMAFDYKWFSENVSKLSTSGEDKELEALLLKKRIHIAYLDDIFVYDEKTQKSSGFYNQRRRWLSTQFYSIKRGITDFLPSLFRWNIDYLDKLIQWMLPPRILQISFILLMAFILSFVSIDIAIKWWILLGVLFLAILIAIPARSFDRSLFKAAVKIPLLAIMMFANLFRIRGTEKKFIHTEKGNLS